MKASLPGCRPVKHIRSSSSTFLSRDCNAHLNPETLNPEQAMTRASERSTTRFWDAKNRLDGKGTNRQTPKA